MKKAVREDSLFFMFFLVILNLFQHLVILNLFQDLMDAEINSA